jgi:hypothetical protein
LENLCTPHLDYTLSKLKVLIRIGSISEPRSCRRETCPSVACPTQIPYELPWDRTGHRDKKLATNRLSCGTTNCVSLGLKLSRMEPYKHNSEVTYKQATFLRQLHFLLHDKLLVIITDNSKFVTAHIMKAHRRSRYSAAHP